VLTPGSAPAAGDEDDELEVNEVVVPHPARSNRAPTTAKAAGRLMTRSPHPLPRSLALAGSYPLTMCAGTRTLRMSMAVRSAFGPQGRP